eukprot:NODE_4704_length_454_cov_2.720988_g4061_i0.p1 GENE.NODE_4704_length_454_cov_2.720988_g4061_i0~~NODE_4704_length_454_cov_2.720988_g4061_i0.p1  ORF type:complete len:129 (-),score=26.90 NODE_4704_length_454_cov_2.720988_g4061_i0:41-427(-)
MGVKKTGELYDPLRPKSVAYEVEVELDAEAFREQKMRLTNKEPSQFHPLCHMMLTYIRGLAVQASKVKNAHINQMTALQEKQCQRQRQAQEAREQEQNSAGYLRKQFEAQQMQIREEQARKKARTALS